MALRIRLLAGRLNRSAGSHVYHVELAKRLVARGYEVTIVCFEGQKQIVEGAHIVHIPRNSYHTSRFWWRFDTWLAYRDICAAFPTLPLDEPDIVVGGEHLLLYPHFQRFPSTPWIYLPHSLVTDREIEGYGMPFVATAVTKCFYRQTQKWALSQANRTMRFTRRACEFVTKYYRLSCTPKFVVNPIGVSLPQIERHSIEGMIRLLVVGGVSLPKGSDLLIPALKGIPRINWELDVVGDGPLLSKLKADARAAGMTNVHFHGFQEVPSTWYQRADLLLFPSRSESLGLVLLEAMSYGVPALAIRHDGREFCNVNEELIEHGRTGILVDGAEGFERQLGNVVKNPDALIDLRRNVREHVQSRFSWERHLDIYESVFKTLHSGRQLS